MYSWMHPCGTIPISVLGKCKCKAYLKRLHSSGILMIEDLYKDGMFKFFADLVDDFNLRGKDNLWKYRLLVN